MHVQTRGRCRFQTREQGFTNSDTLSLNENHFVGGLPRTQALQGVLNTPWTLSSHKRKRNSPCEPGVQVQVCSSAGMKKLIIGRSNLAMSYLLSKKLRWPRMRTASCGMLPKTCPRVTIVLAARRHAAKFDCPAPAQQQPLVYQRICTTPSRRTRWRPAASAAPPSSSRLPAASTCCSCKTLRPRQGIHSGFSVASYSIGLREDHLDTNRFHARWNTSL